MNIYRIFAMNALQYKTWCYVTDCHNDFASLEDVMEIIRLETPEEASIQDMTWDYVCDIHDPDDIWYTPL